MGPPSDRHRPRTAHRGRQGGRIRVGCERDQWSRTALGVILAAVDAGQLTLLQAVGALTTGPAAILGDRSRRAGSVGLVEGAPADLVVFDRSDRWTVTSETLLSRGKNTPLLGMDLGGRVLLTMAGGRLAYEAADA